MSADNPATQHLLYEVNDVPPHGLALSLGAQTAALIVAGIVLTPLIALQATGLDGQWGDWTVFAALMVSGLFTILQARPVGPFGAGHILFMGTSGAFLAVSITALDMGGMALLATLVVTSALFQFVFAFRMRWFRKIINPTIGGTMICLIAVTVMPIAFNQMGHLGSGTEQAISSGFWASLVTLLATLMASLFTSGKLRLWAPLIGILAGWVCAAWLGIADFTRVLEAPWIGLPENTGIGEIGDFGPAFWQLLPAFTIVTLIGALETMGDALAIQELSNRKRVVTDYKVVQGAVNADGLGNLVSGLLGTLPNTTYSTSISIVDLTGVAARRIGIYGGVCLLVLAFIPKISALLQSIPTVVSGAFIMIMLVLLFAHGVRLVLSQGLSFDNGIVFGVSFWVAVGFQHHLLWPDALPEGLTAFLGNGMTSGGICALLLSFMVSMKNSRRTRIRSQLSADAFDDLQAKLSGYAAERDWRGDDLARLSLVVEECFMFLLGQAQDTKQLTVFLRGSSDDLELEWVTASEGENIEALVLALRAEEVSDAEDDLRLKILQSMTQGMVHQQFHDTEFLQVHLAKTANLSRPLGN